MRDPVGLGGARVARPCRTAASIAGGLPSRAAQPDQHDARRGLRCLPEPRPAARPAAGGTCASRRPSSPCPSRPGCARVCSVARRGRQQPGTSREVAVGALGGQRPGHPLEDRIADQREPLRPRRAQERDDRVAVLRATAARRPTRAGWGCADRRVLVAARPAGPGSAARRRRPSAGSSRRAGCGPSRRARSPPGRRAWPAAPVHPVVVAQQPDRPAPHAGDRMAEQFQRDRRRRARR